MTYQKIQLYLNTGLLAEFTVSKDSGNQILYSFDYSPDLWTSDLYNEVIDNSVFFTDNGTLELYKVVCTSPVSEIRFITPNNEIKSITFDAPTTNNKKVFSLSRTSLNEATELTYHVSDSESHVIQNYQNPYMLDRSYLDNSIAGSMIGTIADISASTMVCRDFKILTLGDRYE